MKQIEATPERPFYSVCYQYERNPWALFSLNSYGKKHPLGMNVGRTQQGTDSFEAAKREADKLVSEPGVCYAQVSKTTDCYNHETVYIVKSKGTQ